MGMYNFIFNSAIGPVAYIVAAETPTGRLRIKTISLGYIATNAISTMWLFVLPYIVNPNQGNLGAKTGFIFGATSVLCWIYLFFCQTETAGRNFEEIDELFHKSPSQAIPQVQDGYREEGRRGSRRRQAHRGS